MRPFESSVTLRWKKKEAIDQEVQHTKGEGHPQPPPPPLTTKCMKYSLVKLHDNALYLSSGRSGPHGAACQWLYLICSGNNRVQRTRDRPWQLKQRLKVIACPCLHCLELPFSPVLSAGTVPNTEGSAEARVTATALLLTSSGAGRTTFSMSRGLIMRCGHLE